MAYVPGCRHDLFVSYASENNREGWVEQFANALGREFDPGDSAYLDKTQLQVAQSFPDRLTAAARDSAILAPVLIRPVDEAGLGKLHRDAQRFVSFLGADGQTPLAVGSRGWKTQLRKLAGQLKDALQNLRRRCRPVFPGKAAETERWQNLRAWCRTELERRCLRTAPESLPALDDAEAVRASAQEAGLAVHFPGGADPSAREVIETSAENCAGSTILYRPFGADLSADEQLWLDMFERRLKAPPGRYQEDSAAARARVELAMVCDEADGSKLATARTDTTAQTYAIAPVELLRLVRSRITRDLTADECRRYLNAERCPALPDVP